MYWQSIVVFAFIKYTSNNRLVRHGTCGRTLQKNMASIHRVVETLKWLFVLSIKIPLTRVAFTEHLLGGNEYRVKNKWYNTSYTICSTHNDTLMNDDKLIPNIRRLLEPHAIWFNYSKKKWTQLQCQWHEQNFIFYIWIQLND